MKNQALVSSKGKSEKLKCCLLQFLFGSLRVKEKNLLLSEHVALLLKKRICCFRIKFFPFKVDL